MTLDEVKSLRAMAENHMELPQDQLAEVFDIAEQALSSVPAQAEVVPDTPVPVDPPAPTEAE